MKNYTFVGGTERGYDGGKKVQGRKRHLLVDTLGLLIAVLITSAGLDDGVAAPLLLAHVTPVDFPRLGVIFADQKYHNHVFEAWLATHRAGWRLDIKMRPEGTKGFAPHYFSPEASWTEPQGGLFVWVTLPPPLDVTAVLQEALAADVACAPGTAFFAQGGGQHMMRLNFTGMGPDWIEEGIRRLGGVLTHCLGQSA